MLTTIQGPGPHERYVVFFLAFIILALLTPRLLDKLNPPTGDEPFYLMTAISLTQDGDLEETNNYAARQWLQFMPSCPQMGQPNWGMASRHRILNSSGLLAPGLRQDCTTAISVERYAPLTPHRARGAIRRGVYSKHGAGLSALISPFYALGGRPLVVLFMVSLAALLGVNIWLLALESTGSRTVAWVTWLGMTFTTPIICFAFLIFPAVPAALCVVYSWRRIDALATSTQHGYHVKQYTWLQNASAGLCMGLLPWLHAVYILFSLPLFLVWYRYAYQRCSHIVASRGDPTAPLSETFLRRLVRPLYHDSALYLTLPCMLLGAGLVGYNIYLFGKPFIPLKNHDPFSPPTEIPLHLLGLLFDQKYGLLNHTPFYILALAGICILIDKTRVAHLFAHNRGKSLAFVSTFYLIVIASYSKWWGEWCPPARYLMPLAPLLALPISIAIKHLAHPLSRIIQGALLACSLTVSGIFMWNPHLMFNWQTTDPATLLLWLNERLGFYLYVPAIVTRDSSAGADPVTVDALIWTAGTMLLIFILLRLSSKLSRIEDRLLR